MQRQLLLGTLLLAAGIGLGWLLRGEGSAANGDLRSLESESDAPGGAPSLGDATTRAHLLAGQLEEERAARKKSEAALAKATADLAALAKSSGAQGPQTPEATAPRLTYPAVDAALRSVNWQQVGEAVRNMSPLLKELADHMAAGKGLPSNVGDIQRWNGPLVTAALELNKQGVPGTGVNGSFTHPSVLVNMVAVTLEDAGQPLDATQLERLGRLGTSYIAEDERRLQGYGEDALALEKLVGEARLKDRLYAEIDGLLSEAQREALHPQGIRGRAGLDLFSSGLVLGVTGHTLPFTTRAEFEERVLEQVPPSLRVKSDDPDFSALEQGLKDWTRSLPEAWLMEAPDALALSMMDLPGNLGLPTRRLLESAERCAELFRQIIARLGVDSELAKRLRDASNYLVPVRKS